MNTHKLTVGVATLALVATSTSLLLFAGCSTSSNPAPSSTIDSSTDSPTPDTSTAGNDTGVAIDSPVAVDSGTDAVADTAVVDVVSLDTGSCVSAMSTCNTCYTDAQAAANPYNACSPFTTNCVPFTTPIPDGAVGQL
jgi:hypothetical protein